jgi:hypothetical protein
MAVVLGSGGTLVAPLMLIPKMQEDALRLPPHCPLRKELIRQYTIHKSLFISMFCLVMSKSLGSD